jgi:hypothetical protein
VGLFVHDPSVVVSVCPCCAVPLIIGTDVFAGTAVTVGVCAEVAEAAPPVFLAVTTTSTVSLTSEAWSV